MNHGNTESTEKNQKEKMQPQLISINHDDDAAKFIGRTVYGRQFFLTTPFEPANSHSEGSEYVALFLFDNEGELIEAKIDDFGPRARCDFEARGRCIEQHLSSLGTVTFERIQVKPFSIERFGVEFGLIPRELDDNNHDYTVELLPGNYMAFFPPWDSGEYFT